MSEPIQSISQGNYILQGTVATSAGIVGDGSTQNPLRADETVLFSGSCKYHNSATLSEKPINFDRLRFYWKDWNSNTTTHVSECSPNYTTSSNYAFGDTWAGAGSANLVLFNLILNDNFDKTIYFKWGTFYNCTAASVTQATQTEIVKIVGINRINNA